MQRSAETFSAAVRGAAATRLLLTAAAWLLVLSGAARADGFRVLPGNQEAIQARVDLIQQAQHEIICVYYAVDTGRVSSSILSLLREAAERGVRVRLLVDGLISWMPAEMESYLISAGVEVRSYHPPHVLRPAWLNRRLHDKLLIVDCEQLIIGSRNLKDEHFGLDEENYVDCDAYVRGAAAAHAKQYFEWLWRTPDVRPVRPAGSLGLEMRGFLPQSRKGLAAHRRTARTPQEFRQMLDSSLATLVSCYGIQLNTGRDWSAGLSPDVPIAVLHDCNTRKTDLAVQQAMVDLINASRHSLWIETPYPVFTHTMLEAILAARERGVQVVLVTGSLASTDRPAAYAAYQNLKCSLRRAGVQIREYVGPDYLHSKSTVIDDRIAVIGSYNFDPRSEYLNLEVSIAVYDHGAAAALKQTIQAQLARAVAVENCHAAPSGDMGTVPFAARQLKMQLTRLVVPAFRWLL